MYKVNYFENFVDITDLDFFSLSKTFDCGQCFRFNEKDGFFTGIAFGKYFKAVQLSETSLRIYCNADDFEVFREFLSLDEDYAYIRSTMPTDNTMLIASDIGSGIRILKQDPWEALCSFIISQNNNIPRIKKLVEAISEKYGDIITTDDGIFYSFPSPSALAKANEEDLYALKLGFRVPYILSAAKAVSNDEISLSELRKLDSIGASKLLETIKGVGPKVAACTLLFGFHKTDSFPIDVWVKKILEKYYPELDRASVSDYFGPYAGIAQQYLFYYERYIVS